MQHAQAPAKTPHPVVAAHTRSALPKPAPSFLKPRIKRGITSDERRATKSLMRFVACSMQVFGEDTEGHYIYDRHHRVAYRVDRYVDAVDGALQFNREHYANQVKTGNPNDEDLSGYTAIVRRHRSLAVPTHAQRQ